MNKPDGITQDAWDAARDIEFDFDCDWTNDGRRSGEPERQFATVLIAHAIQSAVEAEREKNALSSDQLADAFDGLSKANKRHRILFEKLAENFRFHASSIRKGV